MLQKCRIMLAKCMENDVTAVGLYGRTVEQLRLQEFECPHCGRKGRFKRHGEYSRYIVEWAGGKKHCSLISIVRFRCGDCGRTHAYLPSLMIPYTSYGLCFVLAVLIQYFQKSMTVMQICESYDISESILYRWVHLFERRYGEWMEIITCGIDGKKRDEKKKDEKKKDGSRTIPGEREHILEFIFCVILSDVFLDNYLRMFHRSLMECEPGDRRGEG